MPLNQQAKQLLWAVPPRNPFCSRCILNKDAQVVCLMGDGPVPSDVMIIGEAPGYREDEVERPFAGRAGQFLDGVLESVGLDRGKLFITNAVKCRPPDNRTPSRSEVKACRDYLDTEIKLVRPRFLLLLGNTALSVVKKSGIMKQRGEVFDFVQGDVEAKVIGTLHPAAILRNPHWEQLFRADLHTFARMVRGEDPKTAAPRVFAVRSKEALSRASQAILRSPAVAYDLETTGHDDFHPEARIATIGVSVKPGLAFVVPIHHPEAEWRDPSRVLKIIGHSLIYSKAKKVAHNAKFDDRWLHRFGVPIYADFDTMIAAHLLDENRLKGLKPLAQMILGVDPWKNVDLGNSGSLSTAFRKLALYNARDADYTLRLYYVFRKELLEPGNARLLRLFVKLLMPASRMLTDMELTGMWIDRERLVERREMVAQKLMEIDAQLTEVFGHSANWNSSHVLAKLLFDVLSLPLLELTKGGKPSTKESVLLRLRDEHPSAELILEWRKWFKFQSTYLVRWGEQLDAQDRLHANYKITGTVTGRLSSGKDERAPAKQRGLNVQQVPRDLLIRSVIGAPPGWSFVEMDYSQIELRIVAHYSQDPTMMRIFQMDGDIHLEVAADVTGKPQSEITKEERKKAKAVDFGFVFGMYPQKFTEYARDNYDLKVSLTEAEAFRNRFFTKFASLPAWHQRQRRLARNYGRVQSLIGYVRHLPDIDSQDKEVRNEAERQAINSPVQGLAAHLMLMTLNTLHEMMPPDEALIVGTVHDSGMFQIRNDVVMKWVPIIREVATNPPLKKLFGAHLDVPLKVDIRVGQHWGEGDEL